jgi:hypothetical protein
MKMAPKVVALFLLVLLPFHALAAERITFEAIMDQVTRNALDVKIAEKDIRISEASRKETLSIYYPTLKGKWNSEYIKDWELVTVSERLQVAGMLLENEA